MDNSEEKPELLTIGYQTAVSLWTLSSQQIYSRFNAMLTANSIIIAAIVLMIGNEAVPKYLFITLAAVGIFLCILWAVFVCYGIRSERKYRRKAKKLEPSGIKVVEDISPVSKFSIISYCCIAAFVVIYIMLLTS